MRFKHAPLGPWPRRLIALAGLSAGIAIAFAWNGRDQAALATAAIAAGAALSVLRQLVNRETL